MPTYGYQCTKCGHEFSVFQKMSDEPVRVCPECSGAVKRLLYPVGIVFKGSGWYVTDSRGASGKADEARDDKTAADTKKDGKSEAQGASPPAAQGSAEPAAAPKKAEAAQ